MRISKDLAETGSGNMLCCRFQPPTAFQPRVQEGIWRYTLTIHGVKSIVVDALDFEDYRSGTVVAASYHCVFVAHPAFHD